jgi:hypothetical protein
MEKLFDNPYNIRNKIEYLELPDGSIKYVTGYHFHKSPKGFELPVVNNFVFKAKIKFVDCIYGSSKAAYNFEDKDGIHTYSTNSGSIYLFFEGLTNGKIKINRGFFDGIWTFKGVGNLNYIIPYVEKQYSPSFTLD